MKFFTKKRILTFILVVIFFSVIILSRIKVVNQAHETFENYYAFRGCTQLLQKEEYFGICKVNTGQTIKMVKFEGKWYLDGDLPCKNFLCF